MSYRLGVYIWGFVLVVWLLSVLAVLIWPNWWWSNSLHKHESLAAATTGVLGVIWSWFLQLDSRKA